ncbi:unnamed protein product [Gadus morhua 'NCC']
MCFRSPSTTSCTPTVCVVPKAVGALAAVTSGSAPFGGGLTVICCQLQKTCHMKEAKLYPAQRGAGCPTLTGQGGKCGGVLYPKTTRLLYCIARPCGSGNVPVDPVALCQLPGAAFPGSAGCCSVWSEADGVWKLTQPLCCDRVTCNQASQPARLIMTEPKQTPGCHNTFDTSHLV